MRYLPLFLLIVGLIALCCKYVDDNNMWFGGIHGILAGTVATIVFYEFILKRRPPV